jgi:small-conductance mechanosensitive channel
VLHLKGYPLWTFSAGGSLSFMLAALSITLGLYVGAMLALSASFRRRPSGHNDVAMLGPVLRFLAFLAAFSATLHTAGFRPASWAALAGFGGLLMGWSLQAPVSGFAAWLLICTRRPFRVGDRVKLQAWDLRGDITHIGMMYTELNQVGGTVGSEDLAGRTILVPNAMLFQNIVVNYTPQQTSAFVLDEVIVRTTYNSDWVTAERILLQAAAEVTGDIVQKTGVQPYIRAQMYDYGVQLYLRYMTPATDRPRIVYELTKRIVVAFARSPDVDFALPYVFSHRTGMQLAAQRNGQGAVQPRVCNIPASAISSSPIPEASSEVEELAASIERHGLLQPIIVSEEAPGKYTVVAGKLRLAACRQLGWPEIPCILSDAPPQPEFPPVAEACHSGMEDQQ